MTVCVCVCARMFAAIGCLAELEVTQRDARDSHIDKPATNYTQTLMRCVSFAREVK